MSQRTKQAWVDANGFPTLKFVKLFEEGSEPVPVDILADTFQAMIDSGYAWRLQGFYGRTAISLVEGGLCFLPGHRLCQSKEQVEKNITQALEEW